jgi:hypothetical protein
MGKDGRTGGQTDRHDEANIAIRILRKAPKNCVMAQAVSGRLPP